MDKVSELIGLCLTFRHSMQLIDARFWGQSGYPAVLSQCPLLGAKRTSCHAQPMSAFRSKADIPSTSSTRRRHIKRSPDSKGLPGPRDLSTSAKDAGHSDTRTAPISVPNVTRRTMRARPPACCWLNDRRGVLDLRMEACAEPLGLGIGSPHHRSDHRGRCQNCRKSLHRELPPFTVRN